MNGWIKIHRILITKPIWLASTPEQKVILITILLMANHQESEWEWKGEKFMVKPGEFVTSLESIKKESGKGVSIQNIRSALTRFKKLGFLTEQATKAGRVISICNWDHYQESEKSAQQRIQQRGNKGATTNKNNKNEKSIGDGVKKHFSPPTLSDIQSYFQEKIKERGISLNAAIEAEKFETFYSSKNWMVGKNKMADWQKAVSGWIARKPEIVNGKPKPQLIKPDKW